MGTPESDSNFPWMPIPWICVLPVHRRKRLCQQGSNALNKSTQGPWSAHRKTKLNFNAVPIAQPASTITPSVDQSTDTLRDKLGSQSEGPVESGPSTAIPALSVDSWSPNSKHRLRTSHAGEGSSKHIRVSDSASKYDVPPDTRVYLISAAWKSALKRCWSLSR